MLGKGRRMATEQEIRVQKERLARMSSDAIRGEIPTWKPHAPARIAGEIILEERLKSESPKQRQKAWYEKWWGIVVLTVICSLIASYVAWLFGWSG